MYIIDNDGFANSDKRFPTRLRGQGQQWLHDEVSGYSEDDGRERKSLLVERWMNFDDRDRGGTEWMDEKGNTVCLRKGGFIPVDDITSDEYLTLLPERYLRPYEPHYVSRREFLRELRELEDCIKRIIEI